MLTYRPPAPPAEIVSAVDYRTSVWRARQILEGATGSAVCSRPLLVSRERASHARALALVGVFAENQRNHRQAEALV